MSRPSEISNFNKWYQWSTVAIGRIVKDIVKGPTSVTSDFSGKIILQSINFELNLQSSEDVVIHAGDAEEVIDDDVSNSGFISEFNSYLSVLKVR